MAFLRVDYTLPSVNDLCLVLILPEYVQEAEFCPVTRRYQGESEPWAGVGWWGQVLTPKLGATTLSSLPVVRLVKCLYMNCVSNNHPLLFSRFLLS